MLYLYTWPYLDRNGHLFTNRFAMFTEWLSKNHVLSWTIITLDVSTNINRPFTNQTCYIESHTQTIGTYISRLYNCFDCGCITIGSWDMLYYVHVYSWKLSIIMNHNYHMWVPTSIVNKQNICRQANNITFDSDLNCFHCNKKECRITFGCEDTTINV